MQQIVFMFDGNANTIQRILLRMLMALNGDTLQRGMLYW